MARSSPRTAPAAKTPYSPPLVGDSLYHRAVLWITTLAAAVRLAALTRVPPGLNQDEAIGAWISWCLLKTGHDMNGQPWPIFYTRGIGDYPSALFLYLSIPFQWLGGLNVWTTRLPGAVSGILCVPLIAYVGTRLFGRRVGLLATALLAINPWHLSISRLGIGGGHCALFPLLVIALLLAARFPLSYGATETPRPLFALLAGLCAGIACYGYPPLRIYFPVLFLVLALAQWRALAACFATGIGRLSAWLFVLSFAAAFIPLAIVHLTDPLIAHRWEMTRLWDAGASPVQIVSLIAARYAAHFSPEFLFVRGDGFRDLNPLRAGAFPWMVLPLMLAGAWTAVARWRDHPAARTLLVLVLVYPAGDLVSRYLSVHSQRSAPGVGALVLLAALGAASLWDVLAKRAGRWGQAMAVVAALLVVFAHARFMVRYARDFDRDPEIYHAYHEDLLQAMRWLKPRLGRYDAVFCTVQGTNEAFSIALVGLEYDPGRWFSEPRGSFQWNEWEDTSRFGKMWFMYDSAWREEAQRLAADGTQEHVLYIVRPGEMDLPAPIETIRGPDGSPMLLLCERDL